MFIDVDANFPVMRSLEPHFQTIRDEALALSLDDYQEYFEPREYSGSWKLFILYSCFPDWQFARFAEENRRKCPKTWELVKDIPDKVLVAFSYIAPLTHIYPHFDGVFDAEGGIHSARCHMGIKVPEGCPIRVGQAFSEYQEGRFLAFDGGRYEHEVGNRSNEDRVTLCVEVKYHLDRLVE
ncbi:MAG: aspartyl/asparaginyl beta-hydroxylase domain-containing protein [Planctomycetota bacterium]